MGLMGPMRPMGCCGWILVAVLVLIGFPIAVGHWMWAGSGKRDDF